jgi:hypothetical protein
LGFVVVRLSFDFTVLDVADEQLARLRLIAYIPAPGTGTREKIEQWLQGAAEEGLVPALV